MHDRTRGDLEQKCRKKGRHSENFAGLRNFAGCEISQQCSPAHLLFFDPLFMVLYKFSLDVILVSLHIFLISLVLSTYISSVKLVTSIIFHSISQSIKLGAKSPLLRLLVIFSPFSFTFLHFLTSQTPLDDDKSRDV